MNMQNKPGLTISQIEDPVGRWCSAGHIPPETFIIDGKDGPTRFFNVVGTNISGIFCEICLTKANKIASEQKKAGK